jgi:hypothetical protein
MYIELILILGHIWNQFKNIYSSIMKNVDEMFMNIKISSLCVFIHNIKNLFPS